MDGPDPGSGGPPGDLPELAFVIAPGQNLFFTELVEALRLEVGWLGARTSLHVGNYPPPRPDLVYVLVPPHEYFTLMHGRLGPPPEVHARSIFVCAEQPGTSFFEHNVRLAGEAGAVFDINRHAIRAFAGRGIVARHLQIGWTPVWDHLRERDRDIDVLFIGCLSGHRERALARYAHLFARHRVRLILSDNSRPNWHPSESFRTADDKWDVLGRTKVLVNLHQDEMPYFEWLRVVQAIINGAVVVSEHSTDFDPLVAGRHFLAGDAASLGLLTELLLADGDRRWRMQTAAAAFVRRELTLGTGAGALLAAALAVAGAAPLPAAGHPFFSQPPAVLPPLGLFAEPNRPPSLCGDDLNASALRRAAKDLKLELTDLRRQATGLEIALATGRGPHRLELVVRSDAYTARRPAVSILMALYDYEEHVTGALDSVLASELSDWELVIVDDGSEDRSSERVRDWIGDHPDRAAILLRHPVNQGLAQARNDALGWARGEFSFILDADNEIYPGCLTRLLEALDDDPGAAFAYGILERFRAGRAVGLLNTLPWEPRRLRMGNYIDAMALLRTSVLRDFGGYTRERRLHGWEDFELWCRLAEAGRRGAFVAEIVARYRTTAHSMLSLTNISATDAFSMIIERHPGLMAGMLPPL